MSKIVITLVINESQDSPEEFLVKIRLLDEDRTSYLRYMSLRDAITDIEKILSQQGNYSLNLKLIIYSADKKMHLLEHVSDITDHEECKKLLRSFEGRVSNNTPSLNKSYCRIM